MRAMVLERPQTPLVMRERPTPAPGAGDILVEIVACGVCRTDLHVGDGVTGLSIGERVGVPWLGDTCGVCAYCRSGRENLCDAPLFTGYTRDGGYATHTIADARFCFPLGETGDDADIAPWLCAGLIGWRSYRMAGEGERLGIYGLRGAAPLLGQSGARAGRR